MITLPASGHALIYIKSLLPGACLDTACRLNLDRDNTSGGEAMAGTTRLRSSFQEAVAGIPDGSTIGFGGFAMPGTPFNLIKALLDQGAKRLTLVANNELRAVRTGGKRFPPARDRAGADGG